MVGHTNHIGAIAGTRGLAQAWRRIRGLGWLRQRAGRPGPGGEQRLSGWAWRLPFDPAAYPLYRRELTHWDTRLGGHWRLGEVFGMLTLGTLCLLPAAIIIYPTLLVAFLLLDEFIGLAVTLPASMLIVREREAHTWSLLRATPYTGYQIAVGKLSGLLYQAWEGVGYLVNARWIGSLLAVPLLALMLVLPRPYPFAPGPVAALTFVSLATAYLLFVYRSMLNLLFGGALGLAVSTLARTSASALVLASVVSGAVTLASGALVWFYVTDYGVAGLFSESVLAGRLEGVFMWLLPVGAITLARLGLTGLLLALAGRRITGLAD